MAAENETADEKSRRLLKTALGVISEMYDRKIGDIKVFGESSVTIVWRAGQIAEIKPRDEPTLR